MINTEEMNAYLRSLLPQRSRLLTELEQEAEAKQIPILPPECAQLLETLILIHRSRKVLEIGTAIGYSTIRLARAVQPRGGQVVTIELDEKMRAQALENFKRAQVDHLITSLAGDARSVIPEQLAGQEKSFDFIFVDAAKGQYVEFFNLCTPLLAPGGLFVADNVLYKGWVLPGAVFPRRKKTLVTRLRRLLQLVAEHPDFTSSLLPVGDGVLVSYYKGEVEKQ